MIRVIRKVSMTTAALLIFPAASLAHLSSTGLGPYYDGVTHFWRSPEEFIPVLALAFLAGLRGKRTGRFALFILPLSWLVGGIVGLALPWIDHSTALVCISFLFLGAFVAADVPFGASVVACLASIWILFRLSRWRRNVDRETGWSRAARQCFVTFCIGRACRGAGCFVTRVVVANRCASSRELDCSSRAALNWLGRAYQQVESVNATLPDRSTDTDRPGGFPDLSTNRAR